MPKIPAFDELTDPADNDVFVVDDIGGGTTKKITFDRIRQNILPAGVINMFISGTIPTGWLECNGQAVSRATYDRLFDAIGEDYGIGDGSTTFNVPNFKGKVPVGVDSGQAEFNVMGETGGENTHTLSNGEMPSHSHGVNDPGHTHPINREFGSNDSLVAPGQFSQMSTTPNGQGTTRSSGTGISISSSGGNVPHNNLQPYLVVSFIIKT